MQKRDEIGCFLSLGVLLLAGWAAWMGWLPAPLHWLVVVLLSWFIIGFFMAINLEGAFEVSRNPVLCLIATGAIGSAMVGIFLLPSFLYLKLGWFATNPYLAGILTSLVLVVVSLCVANYRAVENEKRENEKCGQEKPNDK